MVILKDVYYVLSEVGSKFLLEMDGMNGFDADGGEVEKQGGNTGLD